MPGRRVAPNRAKGDRISMTKLKLVVVGTITALAVAGCGDSAVEAFQPSPSRQLKRQPRDLSSEGRCDPDRDARYRRQEARRGDPRVPHGRVGALRGSKTSGSSDGATTVTPDDAPRLSRAGAHGRSDLSGPPRLGQPALLVARLARRRREPRVRLLRARRLLLDARRRGAARSRRPVGTPVLAARARARSPTRARTARRRRRRRHGPCRQGSGEVPLRIGRSSPSTISSASPASTRKSSWSFS